jgi:glycosyltransferase involved in cell wall biosynthesis
LNVGDYVRFAGYVTRQEVIAAYASADIFALPSFNEGMSIALLEALASGLPVVVTDTGGTSELVRGNGLIVPWADAEGLADALAHLIDSPQLRDEMGRRSEEIAKGFSWKRVSRQYIEVCRQAAERTSA